MLTLFARLRNPGGFSDPNPWSWKTQTRHTKQAMLTLEVLPGNEAVLFETQVGRLFCQSLEKSRFILRGDIDSEVVFSFQIESISRHRWSGNVAAHRFHMFD
jgi:hypothetical protein